MRIYVGTYAKYNSGSIAGQWLDLSDYSDITEFYDACKELHSDEEDPEYMFQDYEDIPECFINESWISEKVFDYQDELPGIESELDAFNFWLANFSYDLNSEQITEMIEQFRDEYIGYFEHNYGMTPLENCVDESEQVKEWIKSMEELGINSSYFDVKAYAHDLELNGDIWERGGHCFNRGR